MDLKILNWNVNGFRSILQKGFKEIISVESPDIFCLQEVKCNDLSVFDENILPLGYRYSVSLANKSGYSGVLTAWREELTDSISVIPDSKLSKIKLHDFYTTEGRILVLEINGKKVVNLYLPSGSSGEDRQCIKYECMNSLLSYLKGMQSDAFNNLIICGDFNICHQEIDIHHPIEATKKELSGFLPDERKWFGEVLDLGFTDAFRFFNKNKREYSWWSFRANSRAKNLGWRLDYYIVSNQISSKITSIRQLTDVFGSDHCPIIMTMS